VLITSAGGKANVATYCVTLLSRTSASATAAGPEPTDTEPTDTEPTDTEPTDTVPREAEPSEAEAPEPHDLNTPKSSNANSEHGRSTTPEPAASASRH